MQHSCHKKRFNNTMNKLQYCQLPFYNWTVTLKNANFILWLYQRQLFFKALWNLHFIVCCKDYFLFFLFAVFLSEFFKFTLVCFLLFFVYKITFYLLCYTVVLRYFALVFVIDPDKMVSELCFYRTYYFV